MGNIFFEITILLSLAAFLSIILKLLRQPLILAYILTGIIIGPFGQLQLGNKEFIEALGQFGVTLLLFMLGLELKIGELRSIGKIAATIGVLQIILTWILGFAASTLMGFSSISSIYIATVLTFSSTILVVKLLSDKRDFASLYGKISIGILLVQDLFAIFVLIFISEFNLLGKAPYSLENFLPVILKGVILFSLVAFLSKSIFPRLIKSIANSLETLFLVSIAWVFGLTAIVSSPQIGFPIEIGGLLAGLALANSIANYQIVAKVRSLRDFFIIIFFVILGLETSFENFENVIWVSLGLSFFVLIVKPLILMTIMGLVGHRKRTSFFTSITLSQISEFSFIVVFLGNRLGYISNEVSSTIILTGIITFVFSNYMIVHLNTLYKVLSRYLFIFEKSKSGKDDSQDSMELNDHVVLIGANRVGKSILEALKEEGESVVVIDFNPEVITNLRDDFVTFFGDISDLDILERAKLEKAKLVISTVPDIEDNLLLIKGLDTANKTARIIVLAQQADEARILYDAGADYVVLPHLAGGRQVAKMLKEKELKKTLEFLKTKDLGYLK